MVLGDIVDRGVLEDVDGTMEGPRVFKTCDGYRGDEDISEGGIRDVERVNM